MESRSPKLFFLRVTCITKTIKKCPMPKLKIPFISYKLVFTSNILKLSILWLICMICSARYVFIYYFHAYLRTENFEPDFVGFVWHRTLQHSPGDIKTWFNRRISCVIGTYDVVTASSCFIGGHIPCTALHEMILVAKPSKSSALCYLSLSSLPLCCGDDSPWQQYHWPGL